jgi:hypothetical protein
MVTVQASEHYSYNSISFLCNSSRKVIHRKNNTLLHTIRLLLVPVPNVPHFGKKTISSSTFTTCYTLSVIHYGNCLGRVLGTWWAGSTTVRSEYKKTGYNLHGYCTSRSNSAPGFHSTSTGIQTIQLPCFLVFPGYSSVVSTLTSLRPHSYRWNLPQADHGETLLAELS